MNRVQIRDALVQQMETVWAANKAACPVFYIREHGTIDLDKLASTGQYFIKFTIKFELNKQANIASSPFHRQSGTLEILLMYKEGASDRTAQGYLDQLVSGFKFLALGGLHTRVPTPGRPEDHDGWGSETLLVPFFADSNV